MSDHGRFGSEAERFKHYRTKLPKLRELTDDQLRDYLASINELLSFVLKEIKEQRRKRAREFARKYLKIFCHYSNEEVDDWFIRLDGKLGLTEKHVQIAKDYRRAIEVWL